jgi:hypothetical protein
MTVGAFRHLDGGVWSQHVEEPLGDGGGSTELDARADVECRPSRGRQRLRPACRALRVQPRHGQCLDALVELRVRVHRGAAGHVS